MRYGVSSPVRTVEDATGLAAALERDLGGADRRIRFRRLEIASVCRDLDLPVTVAERGGGPLRRALGG